MIEAVEASLRRLRTDWIDLYQVHRPDDGTSIEEVAAAMNDLVRAGKIRSWGTSTFPAEQIVEAHWASNRLSGLGPHTEQPPYSILCRGVEAAVLPVAARYGMGVLTWSPLSGGWLTGKYGRAVLPAADSRAANHPDHFDGDNPAKFEAVERLTALAADAGLPLAHMALAWAVEHPAVTSALIGPRTEEQLDFLLGASGVHLDSHTLDAIDEVVAPGVNLNAADAGWAPPGLRREIRRRPPSSWPT
jgi:aryl-alcohol dehydrogenase (NADP+)